MRTVKGIAVCLALLLALSISGCSRRGNVSMKANVEHALDQGGYKDVRVTEDRDKQVITLAGKVRSADDKTQAEQLAKGAAGSWIIANEISIEPEGVERQARAIESNVDGGIDKNYKAVLIAHRMDHIRYDVKNGGITLKGNVDTPQQRTEAEKLAAKTPNVSQVVNELQVKGNR